LPGPVVGSLSVLKQFYYLLWFFKSVIYCYAIDLKVRPKTCVHLRGGRSVSGKCPAVVVDPLRTLPAQDAGDWSTDKL
jgi:hypothetical protein